MNHRKKIEAIMDKIAPICGEVFRYYGTSPVVTCEREVRHGGQHSTRVGPPKGHLRYDELWEAECCEHARYFQ